jgi:hypothetical protein
MIAAQTRSFQMDAFSWKSYKEIKKKAMEKEFSWAGLALSLSIAFFIVASSAFALRLVHESMMIQKQNQTEIQIQQNSPRLHSSLYLA